MKVYLYIALLLCFWHSPVCAQEIDRQSDIRVGSLLPEYELKDVVYYPVSKLRLSDLRGKWLILDFWSKTCTNCIASFPKIDKLQAEFKDQAQFLLIGNNTMKYNKGIKELFDRIRGFQKLSLPVAYDSLIFERFKVSAYPYIIIADPNGVIQAIPQPHELRKEYLQTLFRSKTLPVAETVPMEDSLIASSKLAKWKGGTRYSGSSGISHYVKDGKYAAVGATLKRLYNVAYFGEPDWSIRDSLYQEHLINPVFELKDTTLFISDYNRMLGMYNYELVVEKSKANQKDLQLAMQADLHRLFGFKARTERRKMPCWKLVVISDGRKKLLSIADVMSRVSDASGFKYKKVKMRELLYTISGYHPHTHPFFDGTGITDDVDIELNVDMTNFEAIRKALKSQGLALVPAKKMMKVLVISK